MILDCLPQWRRYATTLPGLAKAFEYLQTLDAGCPNGRYELDGDRMYCLVQRYRTKPREQAAFEAHRKYVDVQFMLAGRETILWAPLAALTTVTQPYDSSRDIGFFAPVTGAPVTGATPVQLGVQQFAILFPEDGHAPGVEADGAMEVVKAVVKVRLPEAR